jgi:DNA (cytosine-5)-methyltransferase 1
MGYKLAGFDVIGCNEIDPKMMKCYIENHHPKYSFLEDIRTFKARKDLPEELYHLDILDGSPPCSSFSIAGNREKDWGKEKVFSEGQKLQVLDTLFFDFIDLAKELQPKIVIAENVQGLLQGNAFAYVHKIYRQFEDAGYIVQHFLLDASKMGVPQRRKRVFFICLRKDLLPKLATFDLFGKIPKLDLMFREKMIPTSEFNDYLGMPITEHALKAWNSRKPHHTKISQSKKDAGMKQNDFNCKFIKSKQPHSTLLANRYHSHIHYDKPIYISRNEFLLGSSFPLDYKMVNLPFYYVPGMSVPPVMIAQIATRIYDQWLCLLKDEK